MTIKFTKTGVGAEFNIETLLFEFKDEECPKELNLEYETALATNQYVGSLQTNQMQGIYLQPITWQGTFFGGSLDIDNNYITAKERADELDRLQGRVIKWWYEGIKQLVIIKKFKYTYKGYNDVDYEITLQPHDIQIAIKPSDQDVRVQENLSLISDDITKGDPSKNGSGFNVSDLPRIETKKLDIKEATKRLLGIKNKISEVQGNIATAQKSIKNFEFAVKQKVEGADLDLKEAREDLRVYNERLDVLNKSQKMLEEDINFANKPSYTPIKSDGIANKQRYTQ